jgi:hypothetical protein
MASLVRTGGSCSGTELTPRGVELFDEPEPWTVSSDPSEPGSAYDRVILFRYDTGIVIARAQPKGE